MSGTRPPHERMVETLDALISLAERLKDERWADYDRTLCAAVLQVVQQADQKLRTAAKSISRVTPEETRSDTPREPWWGDVLDNLR